MRRHPYRPRHRDYTAAERFPNTARGVVFALMGAVVAYPLLIVGGQQLFRVVVWFITR